MAASSDEVKPSGFNDTAERSSHHGTAAWSVQVDATDAYSSEAARPREFVEEPAIDERGVEAVDDLSEAFDHLAQARDDLREVEDSQSDSG